MAPSPTIVVFHDIMGSPTADWIPNTKRLAVAAGHTVITPEFPAGGLASITLWNQAIEKIISSIPAGSIMIGHGIGGTFMLSLLSRYDLRPDTLILVATPDTTPEHGGYGNMSRSFFNEAFDWTRIRGQVRQTFIVSSLDDPFVTAASGTRLVAELDGKLIAAEHAGHMTHADGYDTLPAVDGIIHDFDIRAEQSQHATEQYATELRDQQLHAQDVPGVTTMQSDTNRIITEKRTVIGSELLRQANTETAIAKKTSFTNPRNIIMLIITVALIGGGVAFMARALMKFIPETVGQLTRRADPSANAPIIIDALESPLEINNQTIRNVSEKINSLLKIPATADASVVGIPVTMNGTGANLANLLSVAGATPTGPVYLIADQSVFYGMSRSPSGVPFIIITLPTYDTGYTVMQSWPKTIVHDIGIWMGLPVDFVKNSFTPFPVTSETNNNQVIVTLRYTVPATATDNVQMDNENLTSNTAPITEPASNPDITGSETSTDSVSMTPVELGNELITSLDTVKTAFEKTLSRPEPEWNENDALMSWTFLDEHHILIVRDASIIPDITTRFYRKISR